MTRHSILNIAAGLIAAVLPFTVSAPQLEAQNSASSVVVNVPFQFEVGSHTLPPGCYTINRSGQNVIKVHGKSDIALAFTMWSPDSAPGTSTKVIFHHYGSQYFLREVRTSGQKSHLETIESKAERTARKMQRSKIAEAQSATPAPFEVAVLAAAN